MMTQRSFNIKHGWTLEDDAISPRLAAPCPDAHIYQPIAARLDHPEVGGWRFTIDLGGLGADAPDRAYLGEEAALTLAELLTQEERAGRLPGLLELLETAENARLYMVVNDDRVCPERSEAQVRERLHIHAFPCYAGG